MFLLEERTEGFVSSLAVPTARAESSKGPLRKHHRASFFA